MARGYHSTTIQAMGDSTGDERGEWFGKLADLVAEAHPGYSVVWKPWNTATNYYDAAVSVSSGTLNGGGTRRVNVSSGSNLIYPTTTTLGTGDLEVTVHHAPAAGWAPGGAAASRTLVSRYLASSTQRAFWLYLDEAGFVKWTWSSNGTADAGTVTSTVSAATVFSGSTDGRIRVYHDVDNTATGNDVYFYTSTDGNTWSQLGTTVTTAGVTTSGSASTHAYQLGGRGNTASPTDIGAGDYYSVNVRTGTRGGGNANSPGSQLAMVPVYPELWQSATGTVSYLGAPRITFLSGSASGQATGYYTTSVLGDAGTRRTRIMEPHGQQLVFLNIGHNEGNDVGQTYRSTYNTLLTDVKSRVLGAPVVCLAQNPTYSNLDPLKGREQRGATIISLADSQGAYGLDVWPQFAADQDVLATQLLDNIHPNLTTGSQLWADYVAAQVGLL